MCIRVGCFKNDIFKLPGASSQQTSPGLCPGVNVRGKFKHWVSSPDPQLNRTLLHLWPLPIVHNIEDV